MTLDDRPLSGLRLLLVEDELLIAMDVEQICRDNGAAEVLLCGNAAELQNAAGWTFDAAILDVVIDGQSTLDMARDLRERRIPFVFATGYSDGDIHSVLPDVTVVAKPYAAGDLVEALAAAVAARKA